MVGMAVADDGAVHGAGGVDEEPAGLAEQAGRKDAKPGGGGRSHVAAYMGCEPGASLPLRFIPSSDMHVTRAGWHGKLPIIEEAP